jgi:hypothetical protein
MDKTFSSILCATSSECIGAGIAQLLIDELAFLNQALDTLP